jgi:hypothetical protein
MTHLSQFWYSHLVFPDLVDLRCDGGLLDFDVFVSAETFSTETASVTAQTQI